MCTASLVREYPFSVLHLSTLVLHRFPEPGIRQTIIVSPFMVHRSIQDDDSKWL